ncbi:MAG: TGS domain-containing protein [Nitrospirota bacterium]|jgi:ribosome-interacting GTPase 1
MPANLPPEYYEAEKKFKEAPPGPAKVAALEELIATVPKHKGTDKLRADLRRRLSKLRDEAQKKKKGGRGDLFTVPKEGAAQVALVGFANSGKSSVLAALTNAKPVVAEYPVSTVMPLQGMMPFEDIQLQLVDLPPVGNESTDGWVSGILRVADILLLVIDLSDAPDVQAELLVGQLEAWNIHLKEGAEGGVSKRAVFAANKSDLPGAKEGFRSLREKYPEIPAVSVSAAAGEGLEELRRALFDRAGIVRVYTKEPGKDPDMGTPFTLPVGSTVIDLAQTVHKDFASGLKFACIWGSSKFPGQRVQRDYELRDGDVVELHI